MTVRASFHTSFPRGVIAFTGARTAVRGRISCAPISDPREVSDSASVGDGILERPHGAGATEDRHDAGNMSLGGSE